MQQLELELPLIKHEEQGEVIYQRIQDGYVNATAMCKASNKKFNNWFRLPATKEFLNELSSEIGIPVTHIRATEESRGLQAIIFKIQGGVPEMQGTWVHPQVAINLGQWLSPKFAVRVSKWIVEWMTGNTPKSSIPYHLRRYMENVKRIPSDYFSVLQEMTIVLIGPLEQQGYTLPSQIIPDISEGRMFYSWLQEQGVDAKSMPNYSHKYEDGREVEARMYPAKYLCAFREHVTNIWLPKRAKKYFTERDQTALPYLNTILQLNGPRERVKIEYLEQD